MMESDGSIITPPSTIECKDKEKEDSSIQIDEISESKSKEEHHVSEVGGIMQENNSKEKLLEFERSYLIEQLIEKNDNALSFKEDFGKNEEAAKQISDVNEALVEKEENSSTVKEGLGELGDAHLQLNEALIESSEKDDKGSSFEGILVEKDEKVLIVEEGLGEGEEKLGISYNKEVSDFDDSCLNVQLNVEPLQVGEEDNNVSSNEVVIVNNEKVSVMEEVFREKEAGGADINVDVIHKKAEADIDLVVIHKKPDGNLLNFDGAHLNKRLNEESAQVDKEDNEASLHEVISAEKEKISILEGGFSEKEEETVDVRGFVKKEETADIANVMHKHADETHLHFDETHINEHLNEGSHELDEKKFASQKTLVGKDTKVPSSDKRVGGESIYESDEAMDEIINKKLDVSMSSFTESPNEKDVKPSTPQNELGTEEDEAASFKNEDGQKVSVHKPSVSNLDVNGIKEQYLEELNAVNENSKLTQEPLVAKDDNYVSINNALDAKVENIHMEGLYAKSVTNMSMGEGLDKAELAKEDIDKDMSLQKEITNDREEDNADKQMEVEEMDIDDSGPATSAGKRSIMKRSGLSKQSQSKRIRVRQNQKEDESLCFICFDGGDLVVCDHRSCPKVYHPVCVNRDEEYFKAKGLWICGWHICNSCEKNAHYMCHTCTYSMCKGCFKSSEFACVRGNKGFCQVCIETVMMIEMKKGADQNKDMGELDELFLFKDYWFELNEKLSLTVEELTRARNQLKEPNVASADKEETLNKTRAGKREVELSGDNPENANEEKPRSSSRRLKRNKETTSSGIKKLKKRLKKPKDVSTSSEWASKELLDFVVHMKDGDRSEISHFDVQHLLLAYIKQHNLRHPRKKSHIICDSMLLNLFGKPQVGHLEMLKLLEPHFLIEDTSPLATDENQGGVVYPDPNQMDSEGSSDAFSKTTSDKRRKSQKKSGEKGPAHNVETYAAVDVHNVSKMYLRRNLMENLLDDADMFNEKVVGAFVRIRITGSASNKDMYRLVQIVGTGKAASVYNTGRKTTDITLEILNLNKREFLTIDLISNQEFTEEECKRLRQSVRCGLIDRMTVAQAQEKANVLHVVKVNDALETEKLRFSNLRDRASEQGRKKEHRISVEKLQMLSRPEVLSRRLNKHPEIHIDPNMNLDYVSSDSEQDQNVKSQDNNKASKVTILDINKKVPPKHEGNNAHQINSPITPKSDTRPINANISAVNNALPIREPVQSSNTAPQTSAQIPSSNVPAPSLNENEKIWHYVDPSGKTQGPFSMAQLRKWNANKFFPINLLIWKTSEKQEDSLLLTDALDGKSNNVPQPNQPTSNVAKPINLPANTSSTNAIQPTSNVSKAINLPAYTSSTNANQPTSNVSKAINLPAYTSSTNANQPTSNVSKAINLPAYTSSTSANQPTTNFSATSSPTRQSQLHSNQNSGPSSRYPENNSRWRAGQKRHSNWDSDMPRKYYKSNDNSNRGNDWQNSHQGSRNHAQQTNPQPSNVRGSNIDWVGLQGAINNILPSANVNPVEPPKPAPSANVDLQPSSSQANIANDSAASDTLAQQQQMTSNNLPNVSNPQQMNMTYPNAASMNWGMMAQAQPMNMNWGGPPNMNMAWGPPAQQIVDPNMNVGWVMPGQGMAMQVNPGWVAPVVGQANPNACWVGNSNQAASSQVNSAPVVAANSAPVGVCSFFKNGHCKKGTSCNDLHT